jgi:hypothetical protein
MIKFRLPVLSVAVYIFSLVVCLSGKAEAQAPVVNTVRRVAAAVDSLSSRMPPEQVYLHFDKPYYAAGDTVWFKAYLVDASRAASLVSSILYVELFNDSNTIIKRLALPVSLGMARGDIVLKQDEVPQGVYGIRAYTNWMRNFGDACFYYKYFYIGQLTAASLLVDEKHQVSGAGEGSASTARLTLRLTDLQKQPIHDREFQVSVLEKKKTLYRERLVTSAKGILQVDCDLPGKNLSRYIAVVLEDKKAGGRTIVPIYLNRPENSGIQFMPEGGALVAGLPARVGFRVVGEDGRGIGAKGSVTDSHNKRIAEFETLHDGIGSFDLVPQAGEVYTAQVKLAGGTGITTGPGIMKALAVAGSGTVLRVEDSAEPDSLAVAVYFSPDRIDGRKYLLVAQSRGIVCFGATVVAGKGVSRVRVPKAAFPTGVARFTLLNSEGQPQNERQVFIDRQDRLRISLSTDTTHYGVRDSIALHLLVTDAAGKPVNGCWSLSVTDEGQVKSDSLQTDNILTRLLLSADIRGAIEDPAFYFHDLDPGTVHALDNLLLTQGGAGYDWKQAFGAVPSPAYLAQTEFTVRGRALNVLNKPIRQTHVMLLSSGQENFVKDTLTDDKGVFVFDKFPPFDTATFFIQARNRKGNDFNVGIEMEDIPLPALDASSPFPVRPWYVNGQDNFMEYMAVSAAYREAQESVLYPGRGRTLPTYTVRGKLGIPGSKNLNGAGNADQVIGEDELKKEGKANLLQVLEKEVNGFHEGVARRSAQVTARPSASTQLTYLIHENRVRFIFDGINLGFAMPGADHLTIRDYLQSYSAEDIKGIEVMYNPGRSSAYSFRFSPGRSLMAGNEYAYLEITTRSGNGPYQRHTAGTYLFKPQPFYFPRAFYRPRYPVGAGGVAAAGDTGHGSVRVADAVSGAPLAGTPAAAGKMADLRSTIYWASDIVTDSTGRATVSWFAADRPGTYRIVVEGSDMNGLMGYGEKRIDIVRKP